MLERAPACLEQSGRALLRPPRNKIRTQRALHSAFWSHGAGEIDLPSWWLSLLQKPPPLSSSSSQSIADTATKCLTAGLADGSFLTFLYPAKTLALIHKLAVRDATYLKNRRYETRSLLRRGYSSGAVAEGAVTETASANSQANGTQIALDSDTRHAEDLITAIRHGRSAERDFLGGPISPELQSLFTKRGHVRRRSDWLKNLEADNTVAPEELQRAATELLATSSDALKAHARYIVSRLDSRRSRVGIKYFSMAVGAYFHVGDKERALEAYQEALSQHQDQEATPTILRLIFTSRDWDFGARAWQIFREGPHDEKFFWRELHTLEASDTVGHAISLAQYHLDQRDESLLSYETLLGNFAVKMIETVFQRPHVTKFDVPAAVYFDLFLKLDAVLRGLTSYEQYSMALRQMLSLSFDPSSPYLAAYGSYAVRVYLRMRNNVGLLPEQSIVENLFKRSCQIRHSHSTQLFDVLRSEYGPPSRRLYTIMLKYLEYRQDLKAFYTTLDEARRHHSVGWTPRLVLSVLRMHASRREVSEAQAFFNNIGKLNVTYPGPQSTQRSFNALCWCALIAAYVRADKIEIAQRKLIEMRESGIEPDVHAYRPLFNYYARRGDRARLMQLTEPFLDKARPTQHFVMESLVIACVQDNHLEEAHELLERSQQMRIAGPRTEMWNHVLNAYARRRHHREVRKLYDRMTSLGIQEDEMTYAALITSMIMCRQTARAQKLLFAVVHRGGIFASSYLYACVMMGHLMKNDPEKVFYVHEQMLRNGVTPDFSVKTIMIKATAQQELKERGESSLDSVVLSRAEQVLADTIASSDRKDLAVSHTTPQIGSGTDDFNEVFAAGNFMYLVSLYGANHAIERATAVYDRYVEFSLANRIGEVEGESRKDTAKGGSPPRKLLAGLMNLFRMTGQHEEVDRCWALARKKAQTLAARADADPKAADGEEWVLPARRYILAAPLQEYVRSLIDRGKYSALDETFAVLHREGFEIDNDTWNLYVQAHALPAQSSVPAEGKAESDGAETSAPASEASNELGRPDLLHAFRTCELELMGGWPGWPVRQGQRPAAGVLGRLKWLLPSEYESERRMPAYKTMVLLAAGYMRVRERWAVEGRQNEGMAALVRAAPNTVREISLMPRMEEPIQQAFMPGR